MKYELDELWSLDDEFVKQQEQLKDYDLNKIYSDAYIDLRLKEDRELQYITPYDKEKFELDRLIFRYERFDNSNEYRSLEALKGYIRELGYNCQSFQYEENINLGKYMDIKRINLIIENDRVRNYFIG